VFPEPCEVHLAGLLELSLLPSETLRVAAGASTPQWIIDAVCRRIKALQSEQA